MWYHLLRLFLVNCHLHEDSTMKQPCCYQESVYRQTWQTNGDWLLIDWKLCCFLWKWRVLFQHRGSFLLILGCGELLEKLYTGLLSSFNRITLFSESENILILCVCVRAHVHVYRTSSPGKSLRKVAVHFLTFYPLNPIVRFASVSILNECASQTYFMWSTTETGFYCMDKT
jgi:hypothetical protein